MNTLRSGIIVFLVAVSAACAALAQQPGKPEKLLSVQPDFGDLRPPPGEAMSPEKAFALLDGDGNGRIDAAEWRDKKMAVFFLLDGDLDISLNPTEVPKSAPDVFAAADADGDGRVSAYEFNQSPLIQFDAADANADGSVTRDEFSSYVGALRED